jgi:hypothetical protein
MYMLGSIGQEGNVIQLAESGCFGKAYFNIIYSNKL